MQNNKAVSVCMAVYNGEKFLRQQIETVLADLQQGDELIISDDGSRDQSLDIIQSFDDARIKLIRNGQRHGVAGNFEHALQHAGNGIIMLCDQDDIWIKGKRNTSVLALENCDCILHNAAIIDENGNLTGKNLFNIYQTRTGFLANFARNTYVGCCMAFRAALLPKILPIPARVTLHDMWIGLLAEKHCRTRLLQEKLICYRRHSSNASTTGVPSSNTLWHQLKYRFFMMREILKR